MGENKNVHQSVLLLVPFPYSQFPKKIFWQLFGNIVAITKMPVFCQAQCVPFPRYLLPNLYMIRVLEYVHFLHLLPSLPFSLRTGKLIPINPGLLFPEIVEYCLFYNIIRSSPILYFICFKGFVQTCVAHSKTVYFCPFKI